MYQLLSPPFALNSLLVMKQNVNLDIVYQTVSTQNITSRLLPGLLASGFCLLLSLIARPIPSTAFLKLRAFAPALSVASACDVLSLQLFAWLVLSHYVLAKVYRPFRWLLSYLSLSLYFATFLAI